MQWKAASLTAAATIACSAAPSRTELRRHRRRRVRLGHLSDPADVVHVGETDVGAEPFLEGRPGEDGVRAGQ